MKCILIVDDEQPLREVFAEAFEDQGYTVNQASDGIEGIAQLHRHGSLLDAIISDYNMPHMNGPDFLRAVRMKYATLPVILFAHQPQDVLDRCRSIFTDVVAKPAAPERLIKVVEEAIQANTVDSDAGFAKNTRE